MMTSRTPVPGMVLWTWIVLFAIPAFAQSKPIEIEQSGMQPAIQMGRPNPSWWDVKIKGSGLMEGRLEFSLFNDKTLLTTTITEDLALSGPQQRIRVMLPPVDDPVVPVDQLRAEVRFRGKKLTQDLGSHILRVALSRARTFMMLVATSRLAPKQSAERERVIRRLAFESMAPADLDEHVKTVVNNLEPNDLPPEPMAYCAYELVLLFGDEFRQLKKPNLDALTAWVRAGGSLYVEPAGVLEGHHIDFLRNLTASDPRGLIIQPDSHGRLIPGTIWEDERVLLVNNSLGHVVIRVDEEQPDASMDTPLWRQTTAFLWRLHSDQVQAIREKESDRLSPLMPNGWFPTFDGNGNIVQTSFQPDPRFVPQQVMPPNPQQFAPPNSSQTQRSMPIGWLTWKLRTSTAELVDRLMPDGVQMVPLWVLGMILVSFVVWIGPVDYFVLGQWKARKYTWLTFPLATILVTAFTVWITNRYMSSAETRRALIVLDVGDDGAIVRTNRFELLFVASSRPATTDVRKGVFTPLETSNSMNDYVMNLQQPRMYQRRGNVYGNLRGELGGDRVPSRMEGRIPTEFIATQNMAKWTPQLNRVFSIPGTKDETVVDWNGLTADIPIQEMFKSHLISNELTSRARNQFGRTAMVACLGQNGRWAYDRGNAWSSSQHGAHPQGQPNYYPGMGMDEISNARLPNEILNQPDLFRWMYQHSVGIPYGLFGLITSTGPTGGPNLNDLPILDPSDPNQVLLIVIVPRGDDFVAYRKLVRLSEAGKTGP